MEVQLLTRAADLFQQTDLIDPMIELHSNNPFMLKQYLKRKREFVNELIAIP